MLLVGGARLVGVHFAGGECPDVFAGGAPLLFGLPPTLANRHALVQAVKGLTNNALAMSAHVCTSLLYGVSCYKPTQNHPQVESVCVMQHWTTSSEAHTGPHKPVFVLSGERLSCLE